ncbi:fatty acid synthase subunit beta [Puccinia sorghi]|uniref:Fatty acid synthase subunit beta n=1 Tax=Puccinia sorghi TaxID=27349 RepID=A0A0L6UAF1_9BASI|nr:fatty acid synthase subunit beta [Puccinia sorghi]
MITTRVLHLNTMSHISNMGRIELLTCSWPSIFDQFQYHIHASQALSMPKNSAPENKQLFPPKVSIPKKYSKVIGHIVRYSSIAQETRLSLLTPLPPSPDQPTNCRVVDYLLPSGSPPYAPPKVTQLDLKYKYYPETPWAPIPEVVEDRIDRIKRYYWNVWDLGTKEEFKNLPTANHAIFHGQNIEIVAEGIITFSTIVSNDSDAYCSFDSKSEVPMDFGIKSGWKAIMKSLFPKSIPGNLYDANNVALKVKLKAEIKNAPFTESTDYDESFYQNLKSDSTSTKKTRDLTIFKFPYLPLRWTYPIAHALIGLLLQPPRYSVHRLNLLMNGRMSAESLEAEREQNEDKLWLFGSTFDEPAPPSPQDQADKFALPQYLVVSRGSHSICASVEIKWSIWIVIPTPARKIRNTCSKLNPQQLQIFTMEDEACCNETQAYNYVVTLALFHLNSQNCHPCTEKYKKEGDQNHLGLVKSLLTIFKYWSSNNSYSAGDQGLDLYSTLKDFRNLVSRTCFSGIGRAKWGSRSSGLPTWGVVLRMLENRTDLQDITHLILNELKTILKRRPNLSVILMLATVDAEKISNYIINGCLILKIPARPLHPKAILFWITSNDLANQSANISFSPPVDTSSKMKTTISEIKTPPNNQPYSQASADWNPIHCNPSFASLASLPGTITHGMWSSTATRSFVERVAAEGYGARVKSYDVAFTGMLLPNTTLKIKLKHIGQTSKGYKLISVATYALPDESSSSAKPSRVLVGTAEVAQASTGYVFTGQGSQEPRMGMSLYNKLDVAWAVWDEANRHLGKVYGFSIPKIDRNNPKEKVVHFGGIKGHGIRQRYMEMTYQTTDKDGNVKIFPLFGDIDLRTSRYTFSFPTGLLYATQFTQIALVVTEKAAFEDLREKGLVQEGAPFAGHSLGEFSALTSIAGVLPIASLVDVVFFRGITMQWAVEQDTTSLLIVSPHSLKTAPSSPLPCPEVLRMKIVSKTLGSRSKRSLSWAVAVYQLDWPIKSTSCQELFASAMAEIGERCATSTSATSIEASLTAANQIGYPVISENYVTRHLLSAPSL